MEFEELEKIPYRIIDVRCDDPLLTIFKKDVSPIFDTTIFSQYGIIWPLNELYEKISKIHTPSDFNKIVLIVVDERRFLLTKIKYGL